MNKTMHTLNAWAVVNFRVIGHVSYRTSERIWWGGGGLRNMARERAREVYGLEPWVRVSLIGYVHNRQTIEVIYAERPF